MRRSLMKISLAGKPDFRYPTVYYGTNFRSTPLHVIKRTLFIVFLCVLCG